MKCTILNKRFIFLLCILNTLIFIIFNLIDIFRDMGVFKKFLVVSIVPPYNFLTYIMSMAALIILLFLLTFSFRKAISKEYVKHKLLHIFSIPAIIFYIILFVPFYIPYISTFCWTITDFLGVILNIIYLMLAFE
ncbi:MAG TPA: hypothetical protein QF753_15970 [Victivallales bacterium]|nr:hypothetical protein [Victivallales bacterium]